VIPAPIAKVWSAIRGFSKLGVTFPHIADKTTVEGGGPDNIVGETVRVIDLGGGKFVRERLVGMSEEEHSQSYRILMENDADKAGNPFPGSVHDYLGTCSLKEIKDGDRTFAHWVVRFETEAEHVETMRGAINGGVTQGALERMRDHFAGKK
jgi:hypothetical protein